MIEQKYKNKTFILCATGPSLTKEVVETIRPYKDKFVIFGINDSYKIIDFLDEHYACDNKWWVTWGPDFRQKCPDLSSWTQDKKSSKQFNLNWTAGKHEKAFSLDSNLIHYGSNSGYQALNIAFLMGGKKFILVGYNMQKVGNKKHFFGDHPKPLNSNSPYASFAKNFDTIQPEIKQLVINCTPNSALTCFEKADLLETLENEISNSRAH